jgi:DUF1680 family protein
MKARSILFYAVLYITFFSQSIYQAKAQSGDQILDGIGETGIIARYMFNGDLKDWSRNNLHAKAQSAHSHFVNDIQFGKVLSLSGNSDDFISLPAASLADIESLSLSSWIKLRSNQPGQYLFDFGKSETSHFFAAPFGLDVKKGFQIMITSAKNGENGMVTSFPELNKWVHVAIVIDVSSKSIIAYINGKPVGEGKDTPSELKDIFNQLADEGNLLFIGKSLKSAKSNLNAMIHDFRIYRVALSKTQVLNIYKNSVNPKGTTNGNGVNVSNLKDDIQQFPKTKPQLYNAYLEKVDEVEVATEIGVLPRLPNYIQGTYRQIKNGPNVRVLWPFPDDNSSVLRPGQYVVYGQIPGTQIRPKAIVTVGAEKKSIAPVLKLKTFGLDRVSLGNDLLGHQTKFTENRDKFISTLAKTDPNSFLYMFRHAFGQKQPVGAIPLGVWDTQDTKLRGHASGHYLTAIAQAYASTSYDKALQENFSNKMKYMVNTLYELSQLSGKPRVAGQSFVSDPVAIPFGPGKTSFDSDLSDLGIRKDYWNWGKGFISAYPPDQFIMLEKGAKYGGQKNQVWAPYYTLHKILAGLMDVYEVSGNKKALDLAKGMGNWVHKRLDVLPTDTLIKMWNTYIAGEFGGMNEAMARLYRITGNQDYLQTAIKFDNIRVFYGDKNHTSGLVNNVDLFRGLHANQHIPQVVGSIEMYRVSNNPDYYRIADNFWYNVVNGYTYSIGGVAGARNPANAECFVAQPGTLYENGFSEGGQNETCATYNMLKLSSELFLFDQRTAFMDYYERGLYNHILASVDEHSPGNTYHVPLRPGSVKQFGNAKMTGFTCCNGTAIESSTKLQNSIYFRSADDQSLYVNLYIPSILRWTERKVSIIQSTNFPKSDHTQLTVKGSGKFDINVRVPGWATKGFFVLINGQAQKLEAHPGTYLRLSGSWKDGDTIELRMPFQFHLDPVMDQQNIASLFYGPILLAAQEPEARKDWRKITLNAADISKSIKGDPHHLEFRIDDVVFKPFYDTYGRHSVYLDVDLK